MSLAFEKGFAKYDRYSHYFSDPFPHIFIPAAISRADVDEVLGEMKEYRKFPDNHRTDHVLIPTSSSGFFQFLCSEFSENLIWRRRIGNRRGTELDTWSHSLYSEYDNEKISQSKASDKYMTMNPHRDKEDKVFVCLMYLTDDGDEQGGSLQLYKAPHSKAKHRPAKDIVLAKEIPYAFGNMVVFLNSSVAVHGVGERKPGPFKRKMFCTTVETSDISWQQRVINGNS